MAVVQKKVLLSSIPLQQPNCQVMGLVRAVDMPDSMTVTQEYSDTFFQIIQMESDTQNGIRMESKWNLNGILESIRNPGIHTESKRNPVI